MQMPSVSAPQGEKKAISPIGCRRLDRASRYLRRVDARSAARAEGAARLRALATVAAIYNHRGHISISRHVQPLSFNMDGRRCARLVIYYFTTTP